MRAAAHARYSLDLQAEMSINDPVASLLVRAPRMAFLGSKEGQATDIAIQLRDGRDGISSAIPPFHGASGAIYTAPVFSEEVS